ncbi:transposable element Tc3 transposase [Trichonephila clavipes]|nr:transposable element Tc3 transposase [Trichonephila clavipes]
MITNFFIPELNNHDVQELWFQQDGATCHTARATIDLLKDTFGDRLISRFGPVNGPPRSCDLTPLDYFLWGYVKSLVYVDKPQTLDHLENNVRRVIADIRPQMLKKVIENWASRLDYIRASRGKILPTSNTSSSTEAQAINILLPNHTITLVNVYHLDNSPIDTNILQDLASTSADTKTILGDFNARSPSWGCKILDSKGDQLEDLAVDLNLSILNTGENTYVSKTNGTASALDISAISYASANSAHWKVLDDAISDDFPVLTTLPIVQEPTTQEKWSWNFRKVNWDGFTQELENLCFDLPKHNDAEKLLRLFTSCIQKAAKHHIPRGKRRNNWIPFWKDHNIKDLIQERDSIGQELQITAKSSNEILLRSAIKWKN